MWPFQSFLKNGAVSLVQRPPHYWRKSADENMGHKFKKIKIANHLSDKVLYSESSNYSQTQQ